MLNVCRKRETRSACSYSEVVISRCYNFIRCPTDSCSPSVTLLFLPSLSSLLSFVYTCSVPVYNAPPPPHYPDPASTPPLIPPLLDAPPIALFLSCSVFESHAANPNRSGGGAGPTGAVWGRRVARGGIKKAQGMKPSAPHSGIWHVPPSAYQ